MEKTIIELTPEAKEFMANLCSQATAAEKDAKTKGLLRDYAITALAKQLGITGKVTFGYDTLQFEVEEECQDTETQPLTAN